MADKTKSEFHEALYKRMKDDSIYDFNKNDKRLLWVESDDQDNKRFMTIKLSAQENKSKYHRLIIKPKSLEPCATDEKNHASSLWGKLKLSMAWIGLNSNKETVLYYDYNSEDTAAFDKIVGEISNWLYDSSISLGHRFEPAKPQAISQPSSRP